MPPGQGPRLHTPSLPSADLDPAFILVIFIPGTHALSSNLGFTWCNLMEDMGTTGLRGGTSHRKIEAQLCPASAPALLGVEVAGTA